MEKSHYSLTWDKFHSSMCAGFSSLQQKGELVDLTLAADGHLVKVHQIVLGIASTYIKELIQSADCKHPVIFMNNVSYTTLCSILEYVYTGEVSVAEENLTEFFETAKTLHIRGLDETFSVPENKHEVGSNAIVTPISSSPLKIVNANTQKFQIEMLGAKGDKLTEELHLPAAARNVQVKRKSSSVFPGIEAKKKSGLTSQLIKFPEKDMDDDSGDDGDAGAGSHDDHTAKDFELSGLVETAFGAGGAGDTDKSESNQTEVPIAELQYTVSNRGALQLILNRFMYNLYSRSAGGRVRRWRCVDYRDHRCPAAAVTDNNVVVKRTNLHNHPFHDKRILAKIKKKAVYSAIRAVESNPDANN